MSLHDGRGPLTACNSQFLLHSSLQLLDRQATRNMDMLELIPALHNLLAAASNKVAKPVVDTVEQWLVAQESRLGATADGAPTVCGWLKKVNSKKIGSKRRWVVLDGTTLLYYSDRAVRVVVFVVVVVAVAGV